MSTFIHLRVILWKNIHIRKYYKILTIFELVIPIVVFLAGLAFRDILQPEREFNRSSNDFSRFTSVYDYLKTQYINILYTPNNSFTDEIIKNVNEVINSSSISFSHSESVLHLKNSLISDVSDRKKDQKRETRKKRRIPGNSPIENSKKRIFGVHFKSGAADKKFWYTIIAPVAHLQKDSRKFFSDAFAVAKKDKVDEYVTSGFVGLQFALDTAFIKMNLDITDSNKSGLNISIHKLPYKKSLAQSNPEDLVYHMTLVGFVFLALTIPYNIATEKHSGMKEMMKMMGINEMIIWFGWITYSLMIYPIVAFILMFIFRLGLSKGPYYSHIDASLVWIIFILYCVANMTFLFAMSSIISKHWLAIICSMAANFLSSSLFGLTDFSYSTDPSDFSFLRIGLLCLFPNLVMYNALKALQFFQLKEQNTSLSSFFRDIMDDPRVFSLRTVLMYFIVNILLNSAIIMYISSIRPGRYGYKKHPLFFVTAIFNLFRKKKHTVRASEYENIEDFYFEPVDDNEIGIRLNELQKSFGHFNRRPALKNISLNILKGEVTVILGNNGAGKSTLLNVISGMTSKTSGEIFQNIDGELRNIKKVVGQVGFCPQNIIYFNYLTVEEHILFFGMARGLSQTKATREAQFMMNIFEMQDKADNYVYGLSGGMRRKLGLLIALIGRPEILILDEPTNGLDVNSRRITWDLLKRIRNNRIIIMTTQDMEEADVVGNRIAIMHDGQIFCHGSSNFLNELFGAGYNLKLTIGPDFNEERTTKIIKNIIPSASVELDSPSSIEYKLPLLISGSFSRLFRELEKKLSSLSINNIQLSCTTMDQIFKNVLFLAGKPAENSINIPLPSEIAAPSIELRTGSFLILFQIWALFVKKFRITYRKLHRFVVCIAIAVILGFSNVKIIDINYSIFGSIEYPVIDLSINTYQHSKTFIFFSKDTPIIGIKDCYKKYVTHFGGKVQDEIQFEVEIQEIPEENINRFANHNLYAFRDTLIGALSLSNDDVIRVLYNELIPHSPPISLNIYSNSLLCYLTKNTTKNDLAISAAFEPVSLNHTTTYCAEPGFASYTLPLFWWVFIFHSAILALFVLIISSVIAERIHGIKHIQTMSSLSEITYWLGNFIYDFLFFAAMAGVTVTTMVIADRNDFLTIQDLKYLILALFWYGISGILSCYVFSSLFESVSIFMVINIVLNLSNMIALIAMEMTGLSIMPIFSVIAGVLPPFSFLNFLVRYLYVLINNNHCVYCLDFEKELCLQNTTKMNISSLIKLQSDVQFAPPKFFIDYLFLDIWLYIFLLCFLNSMPASLACKFIVGLIFGNDIIVDPNDKDEEDKYVLAEKEYIKSIFHRVQPSGHALMVHNLQKNLIGPGFHKLTAVADLNFHVDKGSCFGIVGINGAGKSTTFKILTAFTLPTDGDAKVHNISLRKELGKYTSMIGSCPQSNTTFEELTAREMLHLTATLRGLKNTNEHVKNWISILNMEDYQDELIETYSNGGKRKLCVALSLIGDPKVVFMDEPTSGVDPVARQYMYQIIKRKKQSGQSVVIASHNMKECEILCDRVAVLRNGVFKCFGSISALKKQYASGFTLMVKLRIVADYSEIVSEIIDDILIRFENYRGMMRDQRLGLLQFRILSDIALWSEMFEIMDDIKKKFDFVIEDFTITNTTIAEEIFISELGHPARSLSI